MRIVVSANGMGLDARASPVFGRCPVYVFVDVGTADGDHPMALEAVENPAVNAAGGAGIQAAQFVVERGAKAVISGDVGPNAFGVLQAANVPVYSFGGGTVRQAVEAYRAGKLSAVGGATVRAHAGTGGGAAVDPASDVAPSREREGVIPSRQEKSTTHKQGIVELRQRLNEVVEHLNLLGKGE